MRFHILLQFLAAELNLHGFLQIIDQFKNFSGLFHAELSNVLSHYSVMRVNTQLKRVIKTRETIEFKQSSA